MIAATGYDIARALLVSALLFLSGALLRTYVFGIAAKAQGHRTPMYWGGLSALCFITVGIVEVLRAWGQPLQYRFPILLLGTIFGFEAIWTSHKYKKRG